MIEAALKYLEMGYSVIPCEERGKKPKVDWKQYQNKLPDLYVVHQWWRDWPTANVAIIMGRGRFALDLDGQETYKLLKDYHIEIPLDAPVSKTGKGHHIILGCAHDMPDKVALIKGGDSQVDVRGVGYIIAPPSVHSTGWQYKWLRPITQHPPVAPEKLIDLIVGNTFTYVNDDSTIGMYKSSSVHIPSTHDSHWVTELMKGSSEGTRDNDCTRLAGYFLNKLPKDIVLEMLIEWGGRCTPVLPYPDVVKVVNSIGGREITAPTNGQVVVGGMREMSAEMMKEYDRKSVKPIATSFPSLDYRLAGGFWRGELVYLGARPGMGKSAIALQFAREAAGAGCRVLFVSREMKRDALIRRMYAQEAQINATKLRTKELDVSQIKRLKDAVEEIGGLPIHITDSVARLEQIQEVVAGLPDLQMVIIDYLQLLSAPDSIRDRRLQVEWLSQGLKAMAMEHNLSLICISSLSRAFDKKDRRPSMDSLRESGELEHDADVVMLLHREEEKTALMVEKNREGQTGTVSLFFSTSTVTFSERM